ncbi:MAG: CoA-transferase subunit beta [Bdellovibrionales bacterium]|nr:CoA-transferase subunit beta [Bdellovibrionales bacterium]
MVTKTTPGGITASERMAVRASQELQNQEVVFVGIGLPNLACNLARATHAPQLFMIYESGTIGTIPARLPVSIGDPTLVTDSLAIVSQSDIFQCYLQGGLIEVGFLGGAQVDRYGNINTTVIGDYQNPKIRLPGSGGACEIATHSQRVLIMMRMSPKSFVAKCDFITSPGSKMDSSKPSRDLGKTRQDLKLPGGGPTKAITDLGVLEMLDGEFTLTEIYPGVTVEQVKQNCGWDLKIAPALKTIEEPDPKTLELLRNKIDPDRLYL